MTNVALKQYDIRELCDILREYNEVHIISMNGVTNMIVSYDEVLVEIGNGVLYLVIGEDINNTKHSSRVKLFYNAIRVVREFNEDNLVEITVQDKSSFVYVQNKVLKREQQRARKYKYINQIID